MTKRLKNLIYCIGFACITNSTLTSGPVLSQVVNGADIYCLMRKGGNPHSTSWKAAYESIKIQKPGIFKTSPKQAAAMIIEEVIGDTDKYKDCIQYLGEIYPSKDATERKEENFENQSLPSKGDVSDRYDY